ncbi:methyl-accepting chemotaxis protein [Cytobacillus eiseniae]|uniref:Methyl-accepting chemotaxis protein n=1 Tax=Cytobacillus eiseniae TaxID=762947 RepID=A0ABS4RK24_9BACI|nr:methyl-accepting chemotaxis protein [Cytobacillus eiseniae]MBP2243264.1 methyl-accepting chemotaxis protein [Cytobacillus eiseniae]
MTIRKKMLSGYIVILALLVMISIFSILSINYVVDNYSSIIDQEVEKMDLATELEITQKDLATAVLEYVMFGKDDAIARMDEEIETGTNQARKLTELLSDKESKQLLEQLRENTLLLFESNNKIIELKKENLPFEKYAAQSTKYNEEVLSVLSQLKEIQQTSLENERNDLHSTQSNAMWFIIIIAFISIVVSIILATIISRNISKPIQKITVSLEEVSKGNLGIEQVNIRNKDEVGAMATSFNKMITDVRNIINNVQDSSMQLAANAEELTASTEESLASAQVVSSSAEQQMASSEQQTNLMITNVQLMTELNEGVQQIASDNEEMLHATDDMKQLVTKGASVLSNVATQMDTLNGTFTETTELMKKMEKHSHEIQLITSLITEISEQTNLLALNAAIEAARAGEYGKGFAVVADEVRKLAEQSKKSATEIVEMVYIIQSASTDAVKAVSEGGEKIAEGRAKTNESLLVFNDIEVSVEDVVMKVESVSTSIMQMKEKVETVNENAEEVQSLAAIVADSANETSAATEEQLAVNEEISTNAQALANLAEQLQAEVSVFKIQA